MKTKRGKKVKPRVVFHLPKPKKHVRKRWRIIIFAHGKRIEKITDDTEGALQLVAKLNKKEGVKAHVVSRSKPFWPKDDDNWYLAEQGMVWCPYCRRWRWFNVPREIKNATTPYDVAQNVYHRQGVRCCQWCGASIKDWTVCYINDLWGEVDATKKKKRRRRRIGG